MIESIYREKLVELFSFIDEDKLAISYSPHTRSFTIGAREGIYGQEISFCPWTGKKLPRPLSDEFARMLERSDLSILEPESWPRDWRTEEWWIEAGL